ncbi:Crp/Fnr family transcriptional regulator [Yeosuana marina]|uniref:Crp/Fnr family transcriptional regulator n=1 Tax=Yeosuana marina TaxID=1565536 RepID=UPI00141E971C|nr:Crp/Fnr family transcriptional regulator [Yeosuana marina]
MDIKQFINKNIIKQPSDKIDTCPFPTYRKKFKKHDIITRYGQIEHSAYFLLDGILESSIERDGEIKIIDFIFPNYFICSYTSFLLATPSEIQTMALTDCEVEFFYKWDLEEAYKTSMVANQFGRYVTEQFFITKVKRENDFLTKSAEEVYLQLLNERPEIIEKIPVNKVAKYLGIHPESLSRIRSKLIS